MNKEEFGEKFKSGMQVLAEMIADGCTLEEIRTKFGLNREIDAKHLVEEILNIQYDPRQVRRKVIIDPLRQIIKEIGIARVMKLLERPYYTKQAVEMEREEGEIQGKKHES